MAQVIKQKIGFKVSPSILFSLYLDKKKHSEAIGSPVKISNKVGSAFSAHGNYIKGKNIHIVKNKLIVQTWRGSNWDQTERDSILYLNFLPSEEGCLLEMVHVGVPDRHLKSIKSGWNEYYWKPIKAYFKK